MRVLIVDDEPLARDTLRVFLEDEADVEAIEEAEDGVEAIAAIERHCPDLLLLDIRLPELSGLEVIERISRPPALVFTTALEDHAVEAFEHGAVDYLVKPFGRSRFHRTLARVRRRIAQVADESDDRARTSPPPLHRLFARRGNRLIPVNLREVEHLEGAGDYCRAWSQQGSELVKMRLKELERRLGDAGFVRVHRSHLVKLDHIDQVRRRDPHRLELVLRSGRVVPASRAGSRKLNRRFRPEE